MCFGTNSKNFKISLFIYDCFVTLLQYSFVTINNCYLINLKERITPYSDVIYKR